MVSKVPFSHLIPSAKMNPRTVIFDSANPCNFIVSGVAINNCCDPMIPIKRLFSLHISFLFPEVAYLVHAALASPW